MGEKNYDIGKEPLHDCLPAGVRFWLQSHTDAVSLARAYADVQNQCRFLRREMKTDPSREEEYESWCMLEADLFERVYVLRALEEIAAGRDSCALEEQNARSVARPFMAHYGYVDGNGWWVIPAEYAKAPVQRITPYSHLAKNPSLLRFSFDIDTKV